MRPARRFAGLVLASVLLGVTLPGCASPEAASELAPTLSFKTLGGSRVAFQNGIPVPTFGFQPRRRIDLSGRWRVDRMPMDNDLSLAVRSGALKRIVAEAAGRQQSTYDDTRWAMVDVPGSYDPPPSPPGDGAWYRKDFDVPAEWQNQTITLKFGAVNYIADIWLNGHYLGYHEGGSTPFAFDVTDVIVPGDVNLIAVRVDNPRWGTRQDIVPWGLTDWWNYGGLTQPVWLEATPSIYAVRADVVPHLDGADIAVTLHQRRGDPAPVQVGLDIMPAEVDPTNLTESNPASLVPAGSLPIASQRVDAGQLGRDGTSQVHASFSLANADLWSPQSPALYVLQVQVFWQERLVDQLNETFGLRRIAVDAKLPRLLLNGDPVAYAGVALHDERVYPAVNGRPHGGPVVTPDDILILLEKANATNIQLIRADHHPANPLLLMLADRLGYAIWEEIPLYHYTPATFGIAMDRGIPQQMLAEMDLRDMNHPSVLFHGLANESTGGIEREQALATLHNLDRAVDGTRLTGQAAYGNQPNDTTSRPLDVAGYTTYYGVFYGPDAGPGTARALQIAHATFPRKPIMILEFGRWSDRVKDQEEQRRILADTYQAAATYLDTTPNGFLAAATWWTLDDYWTQRPGVKIEHFGLYTPDGNPRPAGLQAADLFSGGAGQGARQKIVSNATGQARQPAAQGLRFVGYLAYALVVALAIPAIILLAMLVLIRRAPKRVMVS
ncbi:MAG TPA: glycoside hydrolase family 2 TIM barrel-domain containing protein [Candidatus Dormibacteraeota bacterium]|nr:glycoside hydrolase family 2 TIM barrel-domain containing protein [Candidatus Dormibacteraeota bacterium]